MPATGFGRWLLDYSAQRASVLLQQIGRSLAEPSTKPSSTKPSAAQPQQVLPPAAA
jgi:hypothetical protein